MVSQRNNPYVLTQEEGDAIWFFGSLALIKAAGTQTGGAFALIEQVCPPGFANPLHMHHAEDEAFYVLEGELTVFIGDQKLQAGPGTYLFGPRDIPHGFRVEGTSPCRLLLLATPAGFEQFVVEMGKPAQELTFPPAEPPDMDTLLRLAAKYNIEILGPLPE